jgi:predicted nucleotidyltransferase component of viral defense system
MIEPDALDKIAREEQTSLFPNVVREYVQHLFLATLYRLPDASHLLFKGGTALRIVFGSPRFSEDLDFSLFGITPQASPDFVEHLFITVLHELSQGGIAIDLGNKSAPTSGGYFGIATATVPGFQPINIEINISFRNGRPVQSQVVSIAGSFVPTYTLYHLPQDELVEEKVFGALRERKKPRDYYDLYFMMRKGMLSADHKKRLAAVADEILAEARSVNFQNELGAFLPTGQQAIIRDFANMLERELKSQLSLP